MDIKEKRKQYYINNKDKLLTYSKQYYYDNRNARLQYYYDNREERQKYNYEYWSINGHKYIEERREKRYNKKFKIVPNIIVYFN